MNAQSALVLALAALMTVNVGCYNRVRYTLPAAAPPDRAEIHIVGITTTAGVEVKFDVPAVLADGQVTGVVKKQERRYPLTDVQRFWVETRTFSTVRTVAAGVGIAAAVVVTVGIVALAKDIGHGGSWGGAGAKCCLYVYSWDGKQYRLDTETATGAITRGLERDDYSLLQQLREQDGEYRLLLSNDQDETQYTDLVELWVVDHPHGVAPRAATDGRLYAITSAVPPIEARDALGNDLLPWLASRDRLIWEPEPGEGRQEVVLTFSKPTGAKQANLLAGATLTPWAGVVGARMLGLLGRELPGWYERIDRDPAARAELTEWMVREELFALKIWVEEPTGWEVRGMMPISGPFVSDERAVPLDVSRVAGDRVRVRLQPPSGFWAFNSFAVDYGNELPLRITKVQPRSARDWAGRDVTTLLRGPDGGYLEMPEVGQRALVTFAVPPSAAGVERTLFLHSRGYYHVNLPAVGEPDLVTFQRILREPGASARFSTGLYAQATQTQ